MQRDRRNRQKGGSALVTAVIIIAVVVSAGGAMIGLASQQAYSVGKVRDYVKARAYAEAGANEAYAILRADFSAREDPGQFPETAFGEGSYDAAVTAVGDDRAVIECAGVCGSASVTVILDVQDFGEGGGGGGEGDDPAGDTWGYSIFANGKITHNGVGLLLGWIQCNNELRANGAFLWGFPSIPCEVKCVNKFKACGVVTIFGTVYAPVIQVFGIDLIGNKVYGPVATVDFPVLDLNDYYQIASDHGQVFSGQTYNGAASLSIPGGVRWYNGNLRFNGALAYQGCVIATGSVRFNGAVAHIRDGDLPAIISRDSYLKVNGASIFTSLIYAAGDITYNGAELLQGAMLCGGNLTFNGVYGQVAFDRCEPGDPGGGGGGGGGDPEYEVAVTAWHQ